MEIEIVKQLIKESKNIVFFGGAGVSTESKIPDFRSEIGLYNDKNKNSFRPEEILSHSFFTKNTESFYDFYKKRMIYKDAKPNSAHYALRDLENQGKLKAIITQNIDGLHQLAGSKNVLELHGSIYKNKCTKCNRKFDLSYVINSSEVIPKCNECNGIIKPEVVLYEESLDMEIFNQAINYINQAEILIVGGSSLVVYPAAGLVKNYIGNKLILINKEKTPYDYKANFIFNDSIGKILSNII